jgi:hypothetical protein
MTKQGIRKLTGEIGLDGNDIFAKALGLVSGALDSKHQS